MEQESKTCNVSQNATHEQEILKLKKAHKAEILKIRERHEKRIKDFDAVLKKAIREEENRVKSSWTWTVGRIALSPAIFLHAVTLDILKFISGLLRHDHTGVLLTNPGPLDLQKDAKSAPGKFIPTADGSEIALNADHAILGCILDTFTYNCFRHEFNILSPDTKNWQELLSRYPVQGVFVESAWFGNQNTWKNMVGKYSKPNEVFLDEFIQWCKVKGFPTIFWNKEDPVHFDYFINHAKQFDFIFTTDEGVVPRYQEAASHNRVFALPFAAQPLIHNPVRDYPRDGSVCFAGTYYNQRYVERKSDMDFLLRPSLDFGLDIYDRNLGLAAADDDRYRFPDIYQSSIRGRLDYADMIKAYKKYKVFLNVNSVRNSPTMFARRVFELLACGTPVISTYSKGIVEILGEGTVLITESEEETRQHLQNLLYDDHYWWKQSLNGMRKVIESHTYRNRTHEIFSRVGLAWKESTPVSFLILSEIGSLQDAEYLGKILRNQIWSHFEVLLIPQRSFRVSAENTEKIGNIFSFTKMSLAKLNPARIFNDHIRSTRHQHVALIAPGHYYGRNYLRDYSLAISYSQPGIFGKKSFFTVDAQGNFKQENQGSDFQHAAALHPGTIIVNKDLLDPTSFGKLFFSENSRRNDIPGMATDPYNFLSNGRHSYDASPERIAEKLDI